MTELTVDDDGNPIDPDPDAGANAPKVLRKQNAELAKANAELAEKLAALEAKSRQADVAEWLKEAGAGDIKPKYVPPTAATKDDVLAWLKEDGADFGWEDPASVDDETVTQQQRIAAATATAGTPPARGTAAQTLHDLKTLTGAELKARGLI